MRKGAALPLLASLAAIRRRKTDISLPVIITFLHVCESEGASIKELAYLCGVSEATVSRAVTMLRWPPRRDSAQPHRALVHVSENPEDARRHMVFLTAEGYCLKDEIGSILSAQGAAEGHRGD